MKILRVHVPGICCSGMSPRVNWYFFTCATPIWGIFCPCYTSHKVQLVELHATHRWDKTLQGCRETWCVRLCNMFLIQNQKLSRSETTTRILCARAQGKTRWQPSVAVLALLLLTGMILLAFSCISIPNSLSFAEISLLWSEIKKYKMAFPPFRVR